MDDDNINLSPEDLKKHIDALNRNTDAIFSLNGTVGKNQDTEKAKQSKIVIAADALAAGLTNAHNQLETAAHNLGSTFKSLTGSAEDLLGAFHGVLRNFIGGALISEVIKAGTDLSKTYRNLSAVGQTFNGSMVDMMTSAANAGVPLDEFARMLQNNSTVAATLTQQTGVAKTSLGEMAKSVRDNTREFGFYGMSLSQIDDLTGSYTETLRIQGRLGKQSTVETSKNIASFAEDISNFSKVTGKDREQIAKTAMDAMHDVGFASQEFVGAQEQAAKKAVTWMASMPGTAGGTLSKMLAQTIGYGNAMYSDEFDKFRQVAGGEFIGLMDDLGKKVMSQGFDETTMSQTYDSMMRFNKNNEASLRMQVAQHGPNAAAAEQILHMMQEMKGIGKEAWMAQTKNNQAMGEATLMFSKLEESLGLLGAQFTKGLFSAFPDLDKKIKDGKPLFDQFYGQAEKFGKIFGDFVSTIGSFATTISGWANSIGDALSGFISKEHLAELGIGLMVLNKVFKSIFGTGVIGGLGRFVSLFTNGFKFGEVKINARNVVVNGLGGGGGGLGDLTGHGNPKEPHGPNKGGTTTKKGVFGRIKDFFKRESGEITKAAPSVGAAAEELTAKAAPATVKAAEDAAAIASKAVPAGTTVEKAAEAAAQTAVKVGEKGSLWKSALSMLGKVGSRVGSLVPIAGSALQALDAKNRLDEGDRVGAVISGIGAAGGVSEATGIGAIPGAIAQYGSIILNTTRDLTDLIGKRDAFDHLLRLDKINGALGGKDASADAKKDEPTKPTEKKHAPGGRGSGIHSIAKTAEPATPSIENNPYKSLEGNDLQSKYDEVTTTLEELKNAAIDQKELLAKIDQGNVIASQIANLTKEQMEMKAVADKKKIDLSKKSNTLLNQQVQTN